VDSPRRSRVAGATISRSSRLGRCPATPARSPPVPSTWTAWWTSSTTSAGRLAAGLSRWWYHEW